MACLYGVRFRKKPEYPLNKKFKRNGNLNRGESTKKEPIMTAYFL